MFENFKKITIKGGCFENDTELELFRKDPLSIVYGRNGSGKTTISHGIAELTKLDDEKDSEYMEENVYSLDTMTAFFTKEEKVQTAKSVLLFLLYVNRPHLTSYLEESQINEIEKWKTEEVRWLPTTSIGS